MEDNDTPDDDCAGVCASNVAVGAGRMSGCPQHRVKMPRAMFFVANSNEVGNSSASSIGSGSSGKEKKGNRFCQ